MKRSWTVGQQLILGFIIPIVVLCVLGFSSFRLNQQMRQASAWAAHVQEEIDALHILLVDLQDMESGQRGYVISGTDEFFQTYADALGRYKSHLVRVRELVGISNPEQARRLAELERTVDERVTFCEQNIQIRKTEGLAPALAHIGTAKGKRLTEAIRAIMDDITAAETATLEARTHEAHRASTALDRMLVAGTSFAVLVVAFVAYVIIRRLDRQIGDSVQRMQSAAAELEAAATQQVRGAKEQASSATEVSTTVRELAVTARQVSESAQRVTRMASDTAQSARGGDQVLVTAQESMGAVHRQVQAIVGHMLDLGRKSQEIGGILDIINELSEQTNILAINATIEAVGAGESGRRFGVVASEIRKLADRVGMSTKEIRRLIDDIRGAANTTVMATEDGAKAVESSTRRFDDVAENLRRIIDYVNGTAEAAREIELSTKQQTTAMEQVSSAVMEVAQTARETEVSSAQTLQTASEVVAISEGLRQLIERRGEGAGGLVAVG
ncbi:methyl-accepting chemotaxis protein [Polyangium sp. 6x1]|uniref:methyl-accepting chemotaxis protein n=1 Tax=Polyangium sp. 6x1 TaxID=3042689 RepID=UPI0024829894|nr:methyl-accepting chemotaxis protein [Polyangium sp. 6x1]MDI1443134.1 methyl-accepting chemotaxis protein [Polyangium sp. 6x1]